MLKSQSGEAAACLPIFTSEQPTASRLAVCVHLTLLPPRLWSFCTYPFPPLESPTSWHRPQEYNLSSSLCQDDLARLQHIDWNSSGNFWVIFFKERKTPDTTEKKLLNAVQLSGLVPHWREQLANSSSKAVRIFALSLLWLSSLKKDVLLQLTHQ